MYIIRQGEVEVLSGNKVVSVLKRGDFIGSLREIDADLPSPYTFKNRGKVHLYGTDASQIAGFADRNPGLIMKIQYDF